MGKIDEKKLAIELSNFMSGLRDKGYPTDMSLIAVVGDKDTGEISCVPLMTGGFEQMTFMVLDKLVSEVKVNGIPDQSDSKQIVVNMQGESQALTNDMEKEQYAHTLMEQMKENYYDMVNEKGENEARMDFLRNVVGVLSKNVNDWNEMSNDKKCEILTKLVEATKEKGGNWFPEYKQPEMVSVIKEIDHLSTFGYELKPDTNDVAYG